MRDVIAFLLAAVACGALWMAQTAREPAPAVYVLVE